MKLIDLKENNKATVRKINTKNNIFLKKAEAMGIKKGEEIIIERRLGRNLVINLEGRKVVIDKDLAKEIEVE